MGKPVSMFSGYSQKENRVTNYVLLVLKMLYEENPKNLGEVLAGLVGEAISSHVGVSFRQQERQGMSVPDGLIAQEALQVYIETKNYDWFYDQQLENHLASLDQLDGRKILLALGNFESSEPDRFDRVRSVCEQRYKGSILFRVVAFEDLLAAIRLLSLSKNLADAVSDFEDFLNEENLLPSWQDWLDVVNCAGLPEDITDGGVYMCPARGGAYSHARCRYFGMYRNKRVELISEIEAVVDVDSQAETQAIKWKNVDGADTEVHHRAREKVMELRPEEGPVRVFLLGELFETDFRKDSRGGMQSSKRYFDISSLKAENANEVAEKLKGRMWSDLVAASRS